MESPLLEVSSKVFKTDDVMCFSCHDEIWASCLFKIKWLKRKKRVYGHAHMSSSKCYRFQAKREENSQLPDHSASPRDDKWGSSKSLMKKKDVGLCGSVIMERNLSALNPFN